MRFMGLFRESICSEKKAQTGSWAKPPVDLAVEVLIRNRLAIEVTSVASLCVV